MYLWRESDVLEQVFVYLNNVGDGGGTAFYKHRPMNTNRADGDHPSRIQQVDTALRSWPEAAAPMDASPRVGEYVRFQPRSGMAVVFFPTIRPPADGQPVWRGFPRRDARQTFLCDEMTHASIPAVDEKFILTQWIWPTDVDKDRSILTSGANTETVTTDGVVVR